RVVAPSVRDRLHRRDLQGQGETHLRQGRLAARSLWPVQRQPRRRNTPGHRHPRGRHDQRQGAHDAGEGSDQDEWGEVEGCRPCNPPEFKPPTHSPTYHSPMSHTFWDERYGGDGLVYGDAPNEFLAQVATRFPPT